MTGIAVAKPINLSQLRTEMAAQNLTANLGMAGGLVYNHGADGAPADFDAQQTPIAQACIDAHVGMRPKTSEEYATEFQDAGTSAARKQEIRDIQNQLLPPEMVPMT